MQYVAESSLLIHMHFNNRRDEAKFSINDKRRRICNAYAAESNLSAAAHYKPLSEGSRDSKHPAIR